MTPDVGTAPIHRLVAQAASQESATMTATEPATEPPLATNRPNAAPGSTNQPTNPGRRNFLGFMVKGAGLAVALRVGWDGVNPDEAAAQLGDLIIPAPEFADELDLTDLLLMSGDPYYYDYKITITPENRVEFEVPRMEQGQGIDLTATMMVAEELDVRLDQIDTTLSPAEIRRQTGQITGGSHATTSLWDPLRKVTAALRQVIVVAAAAHFGVTPDQVTTSDGMAYAPDGRSVAYSDLSDGVEGRNDAARLVEPKDPSEFTIIGTPQTRLDARDIVTGKAEYAMDLDVVPDAMPCVVARPPTLGGTVASYDDSAARNLPGVIAITEVPTDVEAGSSGVAVVARTFGEAFRARDALVINWNAGTADNLSDDDIIEELRAINLPTLPTVPLVGTTISGEFIFPYFAHAPMETMTAIADVSGGKARVWTGAKTPIAAQAKIARDLGLLPTDVEINVIRAGGSFGRRLFFDAAVEAARISSILSRPIKLMFTARTTPNSVGPGHSASTTCRPPTSPARSSAIPRWSASTIAAPPPNSTFDTDSARRPRSRRRVLPLRLQPNGVAHHSTRPIRRGRHHPGPQREAVPGSDIVVAFDLLRHRRRGQRGHPRRAGPRHGLRRIRLPHGKARRRPVPRRTQKVAVEGPWGRSLPSNKKFWKGQGLGLHKEYKSRAAVLAEVEVNKPNPQGKNKEMRVTRVVAALDVNRVVNPRGLEGQVIGAIIDAIAYVIRTGLHLDNGAIRESSYGDFEVPRMMHSPPEIEVHFMPPNGDRPGRGR